MRKQHGKSGFTLMEILVAMVLLSVVAASALSSFSSSTTVVQSKHNTALNVARSYLEQLYEYVRQDTYGNVNAPLALSGATLPSSGTQTLDGVVYTTTYQVNPDTPFTPIDVDGDGLEDYRKVRMAVSW
jgi:prepilin-type N-terminal cleavage/methylation domain-containing protein